MRTPQHLAVVRDDPREAPRVTLETDENEQIEFDGCSEQEVRAKLHDFLAWAS